MSEDIESSAPASAVAPTKANVPLPYVRIALVGAALLALLVIPVGLAWTGLLANDADALLPPLMLAGVALAVGMALLVAAAYLTLRDERSLRAEVHELRELVTDASTKEAALNNRLGELGASHDTMYSLLFKSRRLSTSKVDDMSYHVRDYLLSAPESRPISPHDEGDPARALRASLEGMAYDHAAATRAAARMRDRSYTLRTFRVDVRQAFPELSLYVVSREEQREGHTDITSGVSAEAEYRRTIGALFAVYWLVRIGIDGAEGFSYGVDDSWAPRAAPAEPAGSGAAKKRLAFYEAQDWAGLRRLFVDAGCLVADATAEGGVAVDVERMRTMLALTAIHDIMKVDALLPTVASHSRVHRDGRRRSYLGGAAAAPSLGADDAACAAGRGESDDEGTFSYEGFKPGDVINDHDVALAYAVSYTHLTLPTICSV